MCNDNIDFEAFNDKCNKLAKEYKSIDPTSCKHIDGTDRGRYQMFYSEEYSIYFIHDKSIKENFSPFPKTSTFDDDNARERFDEFIRSKDQQDQTPN